MPTMALACSRREAEAAPGQRSRHEQHQQGAEPVVREPLPHLREEEGGKAARVPEEAGVFGGPEGRRVAVEHGGAARAFGLRGMLAHGELGVRWRRGTGLPGIVDCLRRTPRGSVAGRARLTGRLRESAECTTLPPLPPYCARPAGAASCALRRPVPETKQPATIPERRRFQPGDGFRILRGPARRRARLRARHRRPRPPRSWPPAPAPSRCARRSAPTW
jgi:hypothetical protein